MDFSQRFWLGFGLVALKVIWNLKIDTKTLVAITDRAIQVYCLSTTVDVFYSCLFKHWLKCRTLDTEVYTILHLWVAKSQNNVVVYCCNPMQQSSFGQWIGKWWQVVSKNYHRQWFQSNISVDEAAIQFSKKNFSGSFQYASSDSEFFDAIRDGKTYFEYRSRKYEKIHFFINQWSHSIQYKNLFI